MNWKSIRFELVISVTVPSVVRSLKELQYMQLNTVTSLLTENSILDFCISFDIVSYIFAQNIPLDPVEIAFSLPNL